MTHKLWYQCQNVRTFLSYRVMLSPFPSAFRNCWFNDSLLRGKFEAKIPGFHFLKIKTMEIRKNRFYAERDLP